MTGLVYKEWKQNRWYILSMILCGFAPLLVLLLLHSEISDIIFITDTYHILEYFKLCCLKFF